MSVLERRCISLFNLLLKLYPLSIRRGFSEEMREVFSERCRAAAQSSMLDLLGVLLKEIFDFPGVLLGAYLEQVRASMTKHQKQFSGHPLVNPDRGEATMIKDTLEPSALNQAVAGALPPLLLGLGITFAALVRTDVWYRLPPWQLYLSVEESIPSERPR